MKNKLLYVLQAAMIAALYTVLTILVQPIASAPIQFRVSEALVILPALLPSAVPGLWLGCVLANILNGYGWIDILFGGLATLFAALLTRRIGRRAGLLPEQQNGKIIPRKMLLQRKALWLIPLPAVLFNALIVGAYLPIFFPTPEAGPLALAILISMLQLGLSELAVVYILGIPFLTGLHPFLVRHPKWVCR